LCAASQQQQQQQKYHTFLSRAARDLKIIAEETPLIAMLSVEPAVMQNCVASVTNKQTNRSEFKNS
jgi:hypothetical protein